MSNDGPGPVTRPASAGWFEDPDNAEQLRYFDGILWTSHTTPRRTRWSASEAAADTATTTAASAPSAGPYGYPPVTASADQLTQRRSAAPTAPYAGAHAVPHIGPTTSDAVPLASLAARFGAWLLDSVITWLIALVAGAPLLWLGLGNYPDLVAEAVRTGTADATVLAEQVQFNLTWLGAFAILQLGIGVGYHTYFLSRKSATPGKLVAGISVRLADRPGTLSSSDALRRSVLRPVLLLFAYTPVLSLFAMPLSIVDLLSAVWDPQRRTLHDRIAGTVVVRGPQPPRHPGTSAHEASQH